MSSEEQLGTPDAEVLEYFNLIESVCEPRVKREIIADHVLYTILGPQFKYVDSDLLLGDKSPNYVTILR